MTDPLYTVEEMEGRGWRKVPPTEARSGTIWTHPQFEDQPLRIATRIMRSQDAYHARGLVEGREQGMGRKLEGEA